MGATVAPTGAPSIAPPVFVTRDAQRPLSDSQRTAGCHAGRRAPPQQIPALEDARGVVGPLLQSVEHGEVLVDGREIGMLGRHLLELADELGTTPRGRAPVTVARNRFQAGQLLIASEIAHHRLQPRHQREHLLRVGALLLGVDGVASRHHIAERREPLDVARLQTVGRSGELVGGCTLQSPELAAHRGRVLRARAEQIVALEGVAPQIVQLGVGAFDVLERTAIERGEPSPAVVGATLDGLRQHRAVGVRRSA